MPNATNELISKLEAKFQNGPPQLVMGDDDGTHIKKHGARLGPNVPTNPVAAMAAEAFKLKEKKYQDACDEREKARKSEGKNETVAEPPSDTIKPSDIMKARRHSSKKGSASTSRPKEKSAPVEWKKSSDATDGDFSGIVKPSDVVKATKAKEKKSQSTPVPKHGLKPEKKIEPRKQKKTDTPQAKESEKSESKEKVEKRKPALSKSSATSSGREAKKSALSTKGASSKSKKKEPQTAKEPTSKSKSSKIQASVKPASPKPKKKASVSKSKEQPLPTASTKTKTKKGFFGGMFG